MKLNASANDYIKAKELFLPLYVRGSFEEKIIFFFYKGLKEIKSFFNNFFQSISVAKWGECKRQDGNINIE